MGERQSGLLQWVASVASSVAAVAVIALATAVWDLRINGAAMTEQVMQVRTQVASMITKFDELYPREDARRELDRVDSQLADHEGRIRKLEAK